jgi:hypothetical protein
MANPVTSRMPGTRALRAWLAVFMSAFLVVCGVVHAVAHASQPASYAIVEVSSSSEDTSADDRLNAEGSHCQFCAGASVPISSVTAERDIPATQVAGRRSYDIERDWKNSDPPPPKF